MSLPPLPFVNFVDEDGLWDSQYGPYSKEKMEDYGRACRAAALEAAAELAAEHIASESSIIGLVAAIRALKDAADPA